MGLCVHRSHWLCEGQRTTYWSQFAPSIMWVLLPTEPSHQPVAGRLLLLFLFFLLILFFLFLFIQRVDLILFYGYEYFVCMRVCAPHASQSGCHRITWGLELQVVNCHVGAETELASSGRAVNVLNH